MILVNGHITGVYTFAGGLSAVVMVDVVQLIIMFVGGLALLGLSIGKSGGRPSLAEAFGQINPRAAIRNDRNREMT